MDRSRPLPRGHRPGTPPGIRAGTPPCPFVVAAVLALVAVGGCRVEERPDDVPQEVESPAPPPPAALPEAEPADPLPDGDSPVLAVGEPFWVGESTRAAELRAVFPSPQAVDAYLDRGQPAVRTGDGRVWELGEILVSVEYPGAGPRAVWRVAGPEEVIRRYLDRIREEAGTDERTPLRELGVLSLEVRHCCAEEPSRTVPPQD